MDQSNQCGVFIETNPLTIAFQFIDDDGSFRRIVYKLTPSEGLQMGMALGMAVGAERAVAQSQLVAEADAEFLKRAGVVTQ